MSDDRSLARDGVVDESEANPARPTWAAVDRQGRVLSRHDTHQAALAESLEGCEPARLPPFQGATPDAANKDRELLGQLLEVLGRYVGERGESEGAVDVLERLARELNDSRGLAEALETERDQLIGKLGLAVEAERQRCEEIALRYLSREVVGNVVLAEIRGGRS